MDINDLTKPWGLEVDRVELTLECVLRVPDELHSGPLIMPPSVPGLEGLTGPIQQLAMHFLGQSSATSPKGAFIHCESRSIHLELSQINIVIWAYCIYISVQIQCSSLMNYAQRHQ